MAEAEGSGNNLTVLLEKCMGEICEGWSCTVGLNRYSVVSFENCPQDGVTTYATLGLSRDKLAGASNRWVRQELLFSANADIDGKRVAVILFEILERMLEEEYAIRIGGSLKMKPIPVENSRITGFYITVPSPFDESLYDTMVEGEPVIFPYLIGITASEIDLLRSKGADRFEDRLIAQDIDIWDLSREVEVAENA